MSGRIRQNVALAMKRLDDLIAQSPTESPLDQQTTTLETIRYYDKLVSKLSLTIKKLQTTVESLENYHEKWLTLLDKKPNDEDEKDLYDNMLGDPKGLAASITIGQDKIAELQTNQEEINSKLVRLTSPSQFIQYQQSRSQRLTQTKPVLPPVLPSQYDGNIQNWAPFWHTFESLIDKNEDIPQVQKLTYLIKLLEGPAKDLVDGYMTTAENYEVVKNLLLQTYNKPALSKSLLMDELINLPQADSTSFTSIVRSIERILRQLEGLGEHVNNSMVETMVEKKLPYSQLVKINQKKAEDPTWNLKKLREVLQTVVTSNEDATRLQSNGRYSANKFQPLVSLDQKQWSWKTGNTMENERSSAFLTCPPNNLKTKSDSQKPYPKTPCCFCGGNHFNDSCGRYTTVSARTNRLRELKLCFNCFKAKHLAKDCKLPNKKCFFCRGAHHSALCNRKGSTKRVETVNNSVLQQDTLQPLPPESSTEFVGASAARVSSGSEKILLMCREATLINVEKPNYQSNVIVFFDPGSQKSYINEKLAQILQLNKSSQSREVLISNFGSQQPMKRITKSVQVGLKMQNEGVKILQANTIPYITGSLQIAQIENNEIAFHSKTTILQTKTLWEQPQLLIGADQVFDFIQNKQQMTSGFQLVNTIIGPIVAGKGYMKQKTLPMPNEEASLECCAIENDIDQFWRLETIGVTDDPYTKEDEIAREQFENFVSRNNGRYVIRWPWRQPMPQLADNYGLCIGRLRTLWNKLKSNPELLKNYHEALKAQENQGIIEQVDQHEVQHTVHYLPHQPVLTPGKTTTKLRIVCDASAHVNGASLNDALYRGPVLLPNMCGILLRWRTHKFAMVADIEKAFLQVEIGEEDRDVTRFIWVKDIHSPPQHNNLITYRSTRLPFGVICSPFLLGAVLQKHLREYGTERADELLRNTYVDNVIVTLTQEEEVLNLYCELKQIYKDARMNLRQFATNLRKAYFAIPEEDRDESSTISVLGIQWHILKDQISLVVKQWPGGSVTKRSVLSYIASHYDPLGLITPALLAVRLFSQSLWVKERKWDESLSRDEQQKWEQTLAQTKPISFSWNRQILPDGEWQLHVFADASKYAYTAAVYARTQCANQCKAKLLFSKTRLVPPRRLSIPKCELLAALIAAQAVKYIQKELSLTNSAIYAWTDNKGVLYWLRNSNPRSLPRFVHNRVTRIKELQVHFRYVPSKENPADIGSRGCTPQQLKDNSLWWDGPRWLSQDPRFWPKDITEGEIQDSVNIPESQIKETVVVNHNVQTISVPQAKIIDSTRIGKFTILLGTIMIVVQFIGKLKEKCKRQQNCMADCRERAESILFKQVQSTILEKDIELWQLRKDDKGLYRVHARLDEAPNKMPQIFLPKADNITALLVLHYHNQLQHAGVTHTSSKIRDQFWIPQGRQTVRKVLNKQCYVCKRWKAKPYALPPMPSLPAERVTPSRAFEHTALDYFGPIHVKLLNEQQAKRWVCLFTCLATRAMHLECVDSLSLEAFDHILDRFIAVRGLPKTLVSDNATQFVAAAHGRQIQWQFVAAHAPWKGGCYERLIGLVKQSMRRSIGKRLLTPFELEKLVWATMAILNTRPITQVADDSNQVLRPVDFLLPQVSPEPQARIDIKDLQNGQYQPKYASSEQLNKLHQRIQACLAHFWAVWQTDYLNNLLQRTQIIHRQQRALNRNSPRMGEIVILYDENLPIGRWRLAQIVELIQSTDSQVRTARVRMANGRTLHRPINHLFSLEIPLEVQSESRHPADQNLEQEAELYSSVQAEEGTTVRGVSSTNSKNIRVENHNVEPWRAAEGESQKYLD